MTPLPDDDDALLARAAAGDADAFALFYRRHLGAIAHYLLRRTADSDVAADLTAEVFAAALLAWLYGIAANKLRESLRRRRVEDEARRRLAWEPLPLEPDDLAALIEHAEESAADSAARAAIDSLPHDQRDAILAHVVEERGYAEIAADLECSESVVRQRVSRGLRALRVQIQEEAP
jgi:RNA polymerase sigma-70 factor (ECF subfamily)